MTIFITSNYLIFTQPIGGRRGKEGGEDGEA